MSTEQKKVARTLSNPDSSDVIRPSTSSFVNPLPAAYPLMPPTFHAAGVAATLSTAGLETLVTVEESDRVVATVALRRAAAAAADLKRVERNIFIFSVLSKSTKGIG